MHFSNMFHIRNVRFRSSVATPRRSYWREFAQEGSIPGFKYLLPEYGHNVRRLCWLVIIIVFISVTVYQLIQQFVGYTVTPLRVFVDREYPASLELPTIVLCNTMPWRVTAVRPKSAMHRTFTEMYETGVLNVEKAKLSYNNATLSEFENVEEYFKEIAFLKKNLIVSCTVKRDPNLCNVDTDFYQISTPRGICYAFNYILNNYSQPLSVSSSGAANGLELVLNGETYEAMAGPYTTFGVQVGFHPRTTPLTDKFINTYLGSYTSISLAYRTVKFYEGKTCRNKKLDYFETYTHAACEIDYIWKKIIEKCQCVPYLIPEQYRNSTENRTTVNDAECPKQCEIYEYQTSVTQASVAWEQINQINQNAINRQDIENRLLDATEVKKRYIPKENQTTSAFFAALRTANAAILALKSEVNNVSCDLPSIPSSAPAPDMYSEANLDNLKNQQLPKFREYLTLSFLMLNRSMLDLHSSLIQNESYQNLIYNRSSPSNVATLNSDGIVSIQKGYVYLDTLTAWVQAILRFMLIDLSKKNLQDGLQASWTAKNSAAPVIAANLASLSEDSITIQTLNASFYLPDGRTILRQNESEWLNETLWKFKAVQLDYSNTDSCWNIPIPKPFLGQNPLDISPNTTQKLETNESLSSDKPKVLDMLLCLQILYTSENSHLMLVTPLLRQISILSIYDMDIQQQDLKCHAFICQYLNENPDVESNCTIPVEKWLAALNLSYYWFNDMINQCQITVDTALEGLENFVDYYSRVVFPEYNQLLNTVNKFSKYTNDISKVLAGGNMWRPDMNHEYLINNMTAYVQSIIDYKQFANRYKNTTYGWSYNTFLADANAAKKTLENLIDTIKASEEALLQIGENFKSYNSDEVKQGHGIIPILARYVLQWRNQTEKNLELAGQCLQDLANTTQPLIDKVTKASDEFILAADAVFSDCNHYLDLLKTEDQFFQKNFMVLNVHYEEISIESTRQEQSYQFWTLMSDLGGACGLWLGLSVVSIIEVLDLAIRQGLRYCSAPSRLRREKRSAQLRADRAAMRLHNLATLQVRRDTMSNVMANNNRRKSEPCSAADRKNNNQEKQNNNLRQLSPAKEMGVYNLSAILEEDETAPRDPMTFNQRTVRTNRATSFLEIPQ